MKTLPWIALLIFNALTLAVDVAHGTPTWNAVLAASGATACFFVIALQSTGVWKT